MTQTASDRPLVAGSPAQSGHMVGLGKIAAGVGHLGMIQRPVPRPDAGEVIVAVFAAGVCGTDLHIEAAEFPSNPPVIMGHEVAGVVTEVGTGVDTSRIGQRVALETYYSYCEDCGDCRRGRPNLCAQRQSIGSHVDGGFAPLVRVPARNLWPLPDHLPDAAGALLEPLACVSHSLCDPNIVSPGDAVLVTGPGTIGILAAQVARASGGHVTIVGADRDDARLAIAADLDLIPVCASAFALPRRFDVVIECSGNPAGVAMCIDAAKPSGAYVQIGLVGKVVPVPLDEFCFRELRLTSGFASTPESWDRAINLVDQRLVDLEPLVTEVAALAEWQRVFDDTRNGRGMKYVFDPQRVDQGLGDSSGQPS